MWYAVSLCVCECVCDVSGCICVYMGVCFPKAILNQNVKKKKRLKGRETWVFFQC